MEKIKVLIVEDKLLIAEDISSRLKKHSMEVIDICTSGEKAIEVAAEKMPDLILMDVQLSGELDGISAALHILKHQNIPVIYLTDYADDRTIERAKLTRPASYLTKPFNEADLVRAIDIAFSNSTLEAPTRTKGNEFIFIRDKEQEFVKLAFNDILFLEAARAYCKIVLQDRIIVYSKNMNYVYEQINRPEFIKVHRSYIVNKNKITALNGNMIKIGKDHEIQMSKEYKSELEALLNIMK